MITQVIFQRPSNTALEGTKPGQPDRVSSESRQNRSEWLSLGRPWRRSTQSGWWFSDVANAILALISVLATLSSKSKFLSSYRSGDVNLKEHLPATEIPVLE